ncbi:MAG: oligosaccharide flippase family protein [bacterium]
MKKIKNIIKQKIILLPYGQAILDYSTMSFATISGMMFGFVKGFIVAKILGPTNFGTWKGIEILQLYHQYTTFGTQNGLSREIPRLRGEGKLKEIEEIRNIGFGQIFTVPFLIAILMAMYSLTLSAGLMKFAIFMTSINVMLLMIHNYFVRLLFADLRFVTFSKVNFILSIMINTLAIISAFIWKSRAPYITVFIAEILTISVLVYIGRYKIMPIISFAKSIRLIRIGFPIMMVGFLYGLLTTVDRIIILKYFDTTQLGYYSLLLMVGVIYSSISNGIGEIVYPRMNQKYGVTKRADSLDFLLFIPGYVMSVLFAILSVVLILFISYLVPIFLKKYSAGILPASIFCIGASVSGGSILNTIDRQWYSLVIQFIAVVINVFISMFLIKHSFGLAGVAIGTIISLIIYRLGVTMLSYRYVNLNKYLIVKRIIATTAPAGMVGVYYFFFINIPKIFNVNNTIYFQGVVFFTFLIILTVILVKRFKSVLTKKVYFKYGIVQ